MKIREAADQFLKALTPIMAGDYSDEQWQRYVAADDALVKALNASGPDVEVINIPGTGYIDPITVFLQDFGPGKGRIVIECFGEAYSHYWSAMGGDQTVRQFVVSCGRDYLVGKLWPSWVRQTRNTKAHESYLEKVVDVVREALAENCLTPAEKTD